jgi:hypothetical protein
VGNTQLTSSGTVSGNTRKHSKPKPRRDDVTAENAARRMDASRAGPGPQRIPGPAARLMSLHDLAAYLNLSYAQARELVVYGRLPAVKLPCPRAGDGRPMRRLLVDSRDVDALIERSKEDGL